MRRMRESSREVERAVEKERELWRMRESCIKGEGEIELWRGEIVVDIFTLVMNVKLLTILLNMVEDRIFPMVKH